MIQITYLHYYLSFQKKISDVLEKSPPKPGVPEDLQNLLSQHFGTKRSVIEIEELKLPGNLSYLRSTYLDRQIDILDIYIFLMTLVSSFSVEKKETFGTGLVSCNLLLKYSFIPFITLLLRRGVNFWQQKQIRGFLHVLDMKKEKTNM